MQKVATVKMQSTALEEGILSIVLKTIMRVLLVALLLFDNIEQIQAIINHSNTWLLQDPANVIAIHCKGGKGRTGMIISCLLLKQGIKDSPSEALSLFAQRRTRSSNDSESRNTKTQRVSSNCR